MRLAIMQPYFFPYVGHFSLIAASDAWIVFDLSQYTPKSWMNRNRLLNPAGGWSWITAPVAGASIHLRTWQARLHDPAAAARAVLGALSHFRAAPGYRRVVGLVEEVFAPKDESLVALNVRGLAAVCGALELPFQYRIASALALDLPEKPGPGGWAPAICTALGATSYVNPASGRALFDPAVFARSGMALHFLAPCPFHYATGRFAAEPGLSILDALLWNTPEQVREAVLTYELQHAESAAVIA